MPRHKKRSKPERSPRDDGHTRNDKKREKQIRLNSPPAPSCPTLNNNNTEVMSTGVDASRPMDLGTLHELITKMDKSITSRFDGLFTQLAGLKAEVNEVKLGLADQEQGLKHIDAEVIEVREDIIPKLKEELQHSIQQLREATLAAELYSKKANLLFFNIPESKGENTEAELRKLISRSSAPDAEGIDFANVHRLPTKYGERPIIAKFVKMKDRESVLTAVSRAAISFGEKKVGVAPHLPASMQAERKRLLPIRNTLKAEGKNAKIKITGTKVQLTVNGTPVLKA